MHQTENTTNFFSEIIRTDIKDNRSPNSPFIWTCNDSMPAIVSETFLKDKLEIDRNSFSFYRTLLKKIIMRIINSVCTDCVCNTVINYDNFYNLIGLVFQNLEQELNNPINDILQSQYANNYNFENLLESCNFMMDKSLSDYSYILFKGGNLYRNISNNFIQQLNKQLGIDDDDDDDDLILLHDTICKRSDIDLCLMITINLYFSFV